MWVKLLVLLIGTASLISASGPRVIHDRIYGDVEVEDVEEPFVDPVDGINYRLPNDTFPLTYDIWLSTNIHRGDFAFDGSATIRFQVVDTTPTVTLNIRQMTVNSISLLNENNIVIEHDVSWSMNATLEHLIIRPSMMLPAGQQFSVRVSYNGTIRSDSLGFYRASYQNLQGETVWLASTQFQANEARQAFPW